ncbi:MAG TPA: hypothetical protein VNX46_00470, partial [Candidatus Acidoferrum sp.]|nr:hypothetical protein [Candidatus Acidoferrum sp.]
LSEPLKNFPAPTKPSSIGNDLIDKLASTPRNMALQASAPLLDSTRKALGKDRVGKYQPGQQPDQQPCHEFAHAVSRAAQAKSPSLFHQTDSNSAPYQ